MTVGKCAGGDLADFAVEEPTGKMSLKTTRLNEQSSACPFWKGSACSGIKNLRPGSRREVHSNFEFKTDQK